MDNKFQAALGAAASMMKTVDLGGGLIAHCIQAPSDVVRTEALFRAMEYQLLCVPITKEDDLPVSDVGETLKNIEGVVGKIKTQRQRNAALLGLQQARAWRAIYSLIGADGRRFAESTQDEAMCLQLFTIRPELVDQIEALVGWDEYDSKLEAEAKKSASTNTTTENGQEVSPNA